MTGSQLAVEAVPRVEVTPLRLDGLVVGDGGFRLGPVDLAVGPGEYVVLVGPSGAGKTLLLETVAGLRKPLDGRVWLAGEDATDLPPEHRSIGFVYQDYLLFPHLSVARNIAFGLHGRTVWELAHVGGAVGDAEAGRTAVDRVAARLDVAHLLQRRPSTLSGGEQQRVALARALVTEPRLLLLDEPLGAIDEASREGLQRELAIIASAFGAAVVHVTHNRAEAAALAHRLGVLGEGRLQQVGTVDEVFRRPANAFVAGITSCRNVFSGTAFADGRGTRVELGDHLEIRSEERQTGAVSVVVRPEDVVLAARPDGRPSTSWIPGVLSEVSDQGGPKYATVEVPPVFTVLIPPDGLRALAVGGPVFLGVPDSAVHLF
jgi:ABC-type sugar transport system ATPase subunit